MQWKEEFALGIAEIDRQHQNLFQLFGFITESIRLKERWSHTHFGLVQLRDFARMHFSVEEALMRLFGWPDADGHELEHQYFFTRLDEIERRSLTENISEELITFLESWLTGHIMVTDKAYARHILAGASVQLSPASS